MNIYSTSAQIASEFGFDHSLVMKVIEELDLPGRVDQYIQTFDIGQVKIAQMSEIGFNAIVMNLPFNSGGDDSLLLRWKEAFLANKAPNINHLIAVISGNNSASSNSFSPKNVINEEIRKEAENLILKGDYDDSMTQPFTKIHRELCDALGGDPGYQNVRIYSMKRRLLLGIKPGMVQNENVS